MRKLHPSKHAATLGAAGYDAEARRGASRGAREGADGCACGVRERKADTMTGPIPKAYTQAHRWLIESDVTMTAFALKAGVHITLAARHLSGRGPISRRIAGEYRRAYPGGPWQEGLLRRYKRPLQIRNKSLTSET